MRTGGVPERPNGAVLKTAEAQASVGSNPTPAALARGKPCFPREPPSLARGKPCFPREPPSSSCCHEHALALPPGGPPPRYRRRVEQCKKAGDALLLAAAWRH